MHMPRFHGLFGHRWILAIAGVILFAITQGWSQGVSTSPTLPNWTAVGSAASVDAKAGTITIPASGQLVRTYPVGAVAVNLLSRPYFSAKATNTAALEVGPATLTFVRNDTGGGIVLLGDQALPLPDAIALAADGRSVLPLGVLLSYDPSKNEAVLSVGGSSYPVTATLRASQVDIAVSAGPEAFWTIDSLEVTTVNGSIDASSGPSAPSVTEPVVDQKALDAQGVASEQAYAAAKSLFASGQDEKALETLTDANPRKKDSAPWSFENALALVRLAIEFSGRNDTVTANRLVKQALSQIDGVVASATDDGAIMGDALELGGFVKLRFLGDAAAAKASYQEALRHAPANTAAKAALDRLGRAEAALAQKGKINVKG